MQNARRGLRQTVAGEYCQIQVLEKRLCLDTTISTVVPIMMPAPGTAVNATVEATQTHGSSVPSVFGDGYWYGQAGWKTDGSFSGLGGTFISEVKISGGGKRGVCNTVTAGQDAGTVSVTVDGLTLGKKYVINVVMNTTGTTIGPATYNQWTARALNFGTLLGKPAGSDSNGTFSRTHNNPASTATGARMPVKSWLDVDTWSMEFTGGAAPVEVFRWTPAMSHTGDPKLSYKRQSEQRAEIMIFVIDPALPALLMTPGTLPIPGLIPIPVPGFGAIPGPVPIASIGPQSTDPDPTVALDGTSSDDTSSDDTSSDDTSSDDTSTDDTSSDVTSTDVTSSDVTSSDVTSFDVTSSDVFPTASVPAAMAPWLDIDIALSDSTSEVVSASIPFSGPLIVDALYLDLNFVNSMMV